LIANADRVTVNHLVAKLSARIAAIGRPTLSAGVEGLFLAGQVYEFTVFYREGLGYTTSLFSSSFYTLTGFHGVHVAVGIIMLLSLVGMLAKGRVLGDKAETVEMIGLYWHFVDVVWIVIFTLVYLIPA